MHLHDLEAGASRVLVAGALQAWWVETGHVVFVRPDGAVFALAFDLDAMEETGAAFPVLEGVKVDGATPDLDITPDGSVLMLTGQGEAPGPTQEVVWVSRDGTVRPVDPSWRMQNARNLGWTLSPDGTRLAIALNTSEGDDVWVKELDDGPLLRLTYHPSEDQRPYWSPDGESIYFLGRRRDGFANLYVRRADGADEIRPVLQVDRSLWTLSWTPDRSWMVARAGGTQNQQGGRHIVAYHLAEDTAEVELLSSEYDAVSPELSPDGRWLLYASEESGQWEVYVRPFPDVTSGRTVVSRGGGHSPMWAHSGREIFYISGNDDMMSAAVRTDPSFSVEERTTLFELPERTHYEALHTSFDVTPDDQRFVMVRNRVTERPEAPSLILVEGWLEEVRARAGT